MLGCNIAIGHEPLSISSINSHTVKKSVSYRGSAKIWITITLSTEPYILCASPVKARAGWASPTDHLCSACYRHVRRVLQFYIDWLEQLPQATPENYWHYWLGQCTLMHWKNSRISLRSKGLLQENGKVGDSNSQCSVHSRWFAKMRTFKLCADVC